MADTPTPADAQVMHEVPYASEPKGSGGPLRSRTGKLVLGGVLLLLVLGVAAGAFFVFFGGSSDTSDLAMQTSPASQPAAAGTAVAATTTSPTTDPASTAIEPAEVPLTEVFTFRDIFEPLIKAPTTTSTSGGTSGGTPTGGTSGTGTQTSANTILLQDITVQDGEPAAVLVWNGTTYTLSEGEQVGGSAWQVLEIHSDSVVMLYGDVQVPLSVGQAITK